MSVFRSFIQHLGDNSRIYSIGELDKLISSDEHPAYMRKHRAELLLERIRFIASLLSILIPLWLVIDFLLLPFNLFWPIVVIRLLSTAHFVYLARYRTEQATLKTSLLLLAGMLINLPLTFFASAHYLAMVPPESVYHLPLALYTLLPYIAVGLLGLFPLTLLECAVLALLIAMLTVTGWSYYSTVPALELLPTLWLLIIILGIVLFTSTIQLQYMISIITRTDHDPVTGAQTRKSGVQSLAKAFQQAKLQNEFLSIALVDLDNVQNIIAEFDYATYDHVVLEAADILSDGLRHNDMLVHWGEKVFMMILPGTDCKGARIIAQRVLNQGLGTLPDGRPVTASIGVCERSADDIEEWSSMLELVDNRRDDAKRQGKDRYIICNEEIGMAAAE
ncbi:MAG: GGDEF domain-containing protein [Candidatus Thiodiazotropha endolucinida]